jgi:hypothetical protein
MPKCDMCDQDAAVHVTEVHEHTGEVNEFHLCVEHAGDRHAGFVGPEIGTRGTGTPMTNPAELAGRFLAELQKAGCEFVAEAGFVIFKRKDDRDFRYRLDRLTLRPAVYGWLANAGVSRQPNEVNQVIDAIFSSVRQGE